MIAISSNSCELFAKFLREQLAWHYTTGEKFIEIVDSGFLLPTANYIASPELPVLWFSRNQKWEPTSRKMVMESDGTFRQLSKQEAIKESKCNNPIFRKLRIAAAKLHLG